MSWNTLSKASSALSSRRNANTPNSLNMLCGAALATAVQCAYASPQQARYVLPATHASIAVASTAAKMKKIVVFVDSRVESHDVLLANIAPGAEVIQLNQDANGLAQIAHHLKKQRDIAEMHIISHGEAGALLLGDNLIDQSQLGIYDDELQVIRSAIATGGDIHLWGCEVGAGEKGRQFLSRLSTATGADIAASIDNTGGVATGGNWELEIATGHVSQSDTINAAGLGVYNHVLAAFSVSTIGELQAALAAAGSNGEADTITLTTNITAAGTGDFTNGYLAYINLSESDELTIVGGGNTLDANYYGRTMYVSPGDNLEIRNLTIRGGLIAGTGGNGGASAPNSLGGGLVNEGNLTLNSVAVTANVASGGGGGGGSNGFNYTAGGGGGGGYSGRGGAFGGDDYGTGAGTPGSPSGATGGDGAGYMTSGGKGGSATGGAGGTYASSGGAGGTASNGSMSIGGGGGGGGYSDVGGDGGSAVGGIYNGIGATMTIVGTSTISNNLGAGGGGGGGGSGTYGFNQDGGNGGRGVGAIWNAGTLNITSANFAAMTDNAGASGNGGLENGTGQSGATPAAQNNIFNSGAGTANTNYNPTPTVSDANVSISGASGTGGAFRVGDTVTVTWNNTAGGDNNADITGVTVDFTQFGGGAAVVATNGSNNWTASYTIVAGAIDNINRNVSVTATNGAGSTTTADTTNATVDNVAPTVTDAQISITGASGAGGAYKIGDTITASWNNTAGGDNNSDTMTNVTVDFSQFGGGAAVTATNSSNTWTASYTLVAGDLDVTNRNISFTVTDNAGNATSVVDSSNATVDNIAPIVTDANIAISGGSGSGGAYIIGDTVTASWNNMAGGDNNLDTIDSVTVDFTQFGGGAGVVATNSSGTWTAAYTLTPGAIEAGGRNVAVTAVDNAGNSTTQTDSSNATVDNAAPAVASVNVPANATYVAGDNLDFTVNISGASNVVVNTGGGTPRIALTVGATTRYASFISGSGSANLIFRYTVQSGDTDNNGITVASVIEANGGTLQDGSGNNLNPTLNAVGSTALVHVDAVVPTITSVSVPPNDTYVTGETLSFTVNTTEDVAVNTSGGTPSLPLTIGTTAREANYVSGSGTAALVFSYTVQAGDNDSDGIAIGNAVQLNGGTLRDAAGNDLALTLNTVADTSAVLVDAVAPTLQTLNPADDSSTVAANANFIMAFSENIALGAGNVVIYDSLDTPVATIDVASHGGQLSITNNELTIDPMADLNESASYYIQVASGAVADLAGNAYAGIADNTTWNFTVADVTPPTATISIADTELISGETSLVTITFSESVSGFTNADLTVTNGSLDAVASSDGGITWTATFTPAADTYVLNNVITLANAGITDAAGNAGSGTTNSNEFTVRTQALTLLVTSSLDTGDDETTAATLVDDETDGNGLSLREALFWARANGDIITFDLDSGATGNQGGSITLNGNQLAVNTGNVRIDGDLNDDGSPDVTISANNASRVMYVAPNLSAVELVGLTVTGGGGTSGGGGISLGVNADVTLRNSEVIGNQEIGVGGGGIYGSSVTLRVIDSIVSNNSSTTFGGGIRIVGAGVLHLISSTVSNNTTSGTQGHGAGIQYAGPDLLMVNSTISGNMATGSDAIGGGLRISSGTAALYNSTIVGNAAGFGAGGVSANGSNDIFVNTVVAGNTAGAGATAAVNGSPLATGGAADDVGGTIEVATNSYFGTSATITTDTNNLNNRGTLDLLLGDLADNGGSVMTHRPMAGSALSDAGSTAELPSDIYDLDGDSNVVEALPLDAVGAARISGLSVDIGAVEGNRAPVILDLNGGNTHIEDSIAVVIDNDVTVTDDELDELNGGNGNYSGASLTVARNGGVDASDTFGFVDGSGISLVAGELIKNGQVIATFDTATAGQLVMTYTDANGELPERSDINATMQQITYANTSNDPETSVVLDWRFADEAGASVTETASVTISLKNDAPVVTATGGTPTFTEGGTAVDLFSAVSINPVEAAQRILSLRLTVTNINNGSDEILAIDGSDVLLTQGNALVTATNALDVSVTVAGTTATVTLSHATGITGAAAQAVIDGMTYRNTSENPNPLSRVVTLSSVQDNGGIANNGADTAVPATGATVTISAVNNAPTITGTPATVTDQNAPYNFTPSAADVDSDTLTFSIANRPTWASFSTETGTLSGVPSQANVGITSNIVISVSDGSESTSLPAFSLTVIDVNDAPVISGTPATSLDQDTPYLFTPTASDLDGDSLTFSIANQPAWASFDATTGTLTGTPDVNDVGIYPNIIITVSDGALTANLPGFSVEVLATNVAPEISGTPPLTAYVGAAYSFTPTASDADDDELTFSALGLPSWLTLDTTTGQLSGTPMAADADMSYNIALSVSDGIETATLPVFSLTVEYDGAEPVVTPPEDITINAIGLYTPISLRQLLSLPPGTSASAVQEALRDLASDSTGGEDCCVTEPQGLPGNVILLPPGRHEIVWRATNPDGLTGEAVQVVNVRPRVAFGKHQVAVENTSVQVRVILNGRSPFYPLEVPYVIDPASSALLGIDHDAMDGSVTFTEGQTEVSFTVNLLAGGTPGDTRLIIRLDDDSPRSNEPIPNYDPANPDIRDINAGAADHHFINIVEGNVIPKVSLVMNQSGADTILVGAGSGPMTATAVVTDPNPGDTHSFNWGGTDSRLSDTDGSATNNTFVFDPAGQVGLRKLEVVTTDSAGGVDTSHLYFLIVPSLPTLDAGTDTDEDGVDDLTEGTSDSNSNGIPDYLDNMPSSNVLPQVIISTTSYLVECDPGVVCGIGQFALGGGSGGVQILNDELGVTEGLVADEDFEPAGGIFDFVIRDLPTAGQSVRIVIPQQAPIPANAVYRKFKSGVWVNFVENADNTLHSAPGNPGYCPPPGDETWAPGLVEGYLCVQLNIQDGGPNDADGIVNSAIADPGAVSSAKPVEPPPPPPPPPATSIDSKGGGALDWTWVLFGGVLLVLRRYGSKKPAALLLVVALFSGAGQAQAEAGDTYLRLNVYQAKGGQSAGDFTGDMAGEGITLSLRDYDVSRVAYRLSVGYQWTEATSVELGYLDLGDVTVNFDTTTTDMATLTRALEEHYPMSADGFTLSHRFGHHFTSGLSLSGEVGIFMWDGKIDVDGAAIDPDLGSGIDPLVGLQLDYRLAQPVSIGLGYQRIFFDGQAVDLTGITATWHF